MVEVLVEQRRGHRRVEGDGNAAGEKRSEEGHEVLPAGWQHESHPLAASEALGDKTPGDGRGVVPESAVGEVLHRRAARRAEDADAHKIRMLLHVPSQGLGERRGFSRPGFAGRPGDRRRTGTQAVRRSPWTPGPGGRLGANLPA